MTAQRPPINYYGSKVRLAPWIAAMLPAHRCYVEPFFGSGAVPFAKPVSTHEIVSDKDATVVNFFNVLRDRPRELAPGLRADPTPATGTPPRFSPRPGTPGPAGDLLPPSLVAVATPSS